MRVLVTGINGFVGGHLAKHLSEQGHQVFGGGMESEPNSALGNNVEAYYQANLTMSDEVDTLPLRDVDAVIHLAGLAAVGPSFDRPHQYMEVNESSVIELFEAAQRQEAKPRFLIVSSGAVYSSKHESRDEKTPVEVSSPYVASKLGSEIWADYYRQRGFDVVIARPFNHAGPGQAKGFIIPDVASQIVDLDGTDGAKIQVGNIATERDYTDVRDVVRAYTSLITTPDLKHELYNICSNQAVSGKTILETLLKLSDNPNMEYEAAVSQLRPTDVAKVVGSYERIKQDTGWQPEISLEQTLKDALADWKSKS